MVDAELLKLIIVLVLAIVAAITGTKSLTTRELKRLLGPPQQGATFSSLVERIARLEERVAMLTEEIKNLRRRLESGGS